jgi:hypothetical protein
MRECQFSKGAGSQRYLSREIMAREIMAREIMAREIMKCVAAMPIQPRAAQGNPDESVIYCFILMRCVLILSDTA